MYVCMMYVCMHACMYVCMLYVWDVWDGWKHAWMHRWREGCMYALIHAGFDGWMDG